LCAKQLISRSPDRCAGDRLGEQPLGAIRLDAVGAQQIPQQAPGQQVIVAKAAGALDRLLPQGQPPLRFTGEVVGTAERGERFDERPVVAELAGELHRALP